MLVEYQREDGLKHDFYSATFRSGRQEGGNGENGGKVEKGRLVAQAGTWEQN